LAIAITLGRIRPDVLFDFCANVISPDPGQIRGVLSG
jgi:hypothetical protein